MNLNNINNIANTDTVVSTNNREQVEKKEGVWQNTKGKAKVKSGTIKGSELNLEPDSVEEKKKKAMQDAMEFIKNQFKSDGKVDEVLDECRDAIKTGKAAAQEAFEELKDIEKRKEDLGELYSDKEDEEYKMRLAEIDKEASYWKKQYKNAHDIIGTATGGIKSIKQEALKYHGMIDAQKAAEETLQAASDEIIGMLKEEAVDKIDEDLNDVVEEAREKKEEEVKQEAEQEEIRAEREKQAEKIEEELEKQKKRSADIPDFANIDVSELLNKQEEVMRNTQKILDEQKLLEDEIKGIVVDSLL